MEKKRSKLSIFLIVLVGCILLAVLFSLLRDQGLFDKATGKPAALTGFGRYSPVEIDGGVYFPTVSGSAIRYETARHAQTVKGAPVLMAASGTAQLPENYIKRLYEAFGKVDYTTGDFRDGDTTYLIAVPDGDATAVCGVVMRHNEQFYLGNFECEITDDLLADLLPALGSLGEK